MSELPRILAVDDESRGVELVRRILRDLATVETAISGEEGWERLAASGYDLVISDQRMPGMSGVELLARVAEAFPATGRILLTGYADAVDTVEAINQARVHAYLHKPCPPDHLRLTVRSVLEQIETLKENARLAGELRARGRAGDLPGPGGDALRELVQAAAGLRAAAKDALGAPDPQAARELLARIDAMGQRIETLCADLSAAQPAG